jgi:hypothetical protein
MRAVRSFWVLATGRCVVSFFEKRTLPVFASTRIADLAVISGAVWAWRGMMARRQRNAGSRRAVMS